MYFIEIGGKVVTASTWESVVRYIKDRYPDAVIGHTGDMEDGGDRTHCWESEVDPASGDMPLIIASITHVHDADD